MLFCFITVRGLEWFLQNRSICKHTTTDIFCDHQHLKCLLLCEHFGNVVCDPVQGPHSDILMMVVRREGGYRGFSRGSYFIPPKIPISEYVTQKNPTQTVDCAYVIVDLS